MNYIQLHIGDYEKDTAHLTATEDGIYGRLLRLYYTVEGALADDVRALQRRVRAHSEVEKEAVVTVLGEFFVLDSATSQWRHKRCDEEIGRYNEKKDKARRSAEARWTHARRAADGDAPEMRTHSDRNANASETHSDRNANASETHSEGNAPQEPITNNHKSGNGSRPVDSDPRTHVATPVPENGESVVLSAEEISQRCAQVCRMLRFSHSIADVNPGHAVLRALVSAGATVEEFDAAAGEARGKNKPFPYLLTVLESARKRASAVAALPPGVMPQAPPRSRAESFRERDERAARERVAELTGRSPRQPADVIDINATVVATKRIAE